MIYLENQAETAQVVYLPKQEEIITEKENGDTD